MKPLQATVAKATIRHCPFKSSNLSTDDVLLPLSHPPIANKAPSAATNSWRDLP